MEDFFTLAGGLSEQAETLQYTDDDAERIRWDTLTSDLPQSTTQKDIYQELISLKKEADLDLHGLFLSDYHMRLQILQAVPMVLKLNQAVKEYKTDQVRFKREKVEKVKADYSEDRVYKWLNGHNEQPRFARNRRPIRKPRQFTINRTSAESTSDFDNQRRPENSGPSVHFLERGNTSTGITTRQQSRQEFKANNTSLDVDRGATHSGARGRHPRRR
ncbi:Hypothetical predicted protein [Pelobates cultripes]|uniref:Uncharacterized protein n=1 Tax=Pelobates cultripes TaxID=61616 RepID=A0AAD1SAI8_PELCU|nr:Hypothetical predicted protein [Pelobates cultripes]